MTKTAIVALVSLLFASALSAQAAPSAALGEARVALVIGNGAYPNVPLKNPVNDAHDLAGALKGLGFSVTLVTDGDLAAMSRAIRDFGNAIKRPDAVALFYYSGHGVQYQGANYLVPARSDIQSQDELSFSAVNADQVYAKMESSGDRTNIVILDACRNNPFPGSERAMERGLAVVGNIQPPQSLIVYATAPGKTAQDGEGRNGVFTSALLKHLSEPNLDAELMVRRVREDVIAATKGAQVPWDNSSITGAGFFFAKRDAPPASTELAVAAASAMAAGKGRLRITSDPSGMQVSVDGGDPLETPVGLELESGAHSFQPQTSAIDRIYYAGEQKQWITISPGADVTVPLHPKAAEATLEFKLAPPGYKVFLNDQELGETPMGPTKVKAGFYTIRFEREGESPRIMYAGTQPEGTALVSWGASLQTAVQLENRTIALNGKRDSWGDIDPVYDTALKPMNFMGDAKYGIKSVFICRDAKYLYWRVDFQEQSPLWKLPKGTKVGISVQLGIGIGDRKGLYVGIFRGTADNKEYPYCNIWGDNRKQADLSSIDVAFNNASTMLVGRVAMSKIASYCRDPLPIWIDVSANSDKGAPQDSEHAQNIFVDFSK